MSSCSTQSINLTDPSASYMDALQATEASPADRLATGSQAERSAIEQFQGFWATFTYEVVTQRVRDIYADDVYLRDGVREIQGIDALAAYMAKSTEPLRSCTFEFQRVVQQDGNYFFQWTMHVNLLRDPVDRVGEAIGMSHVRFNPAGKVTFQQDYWDPSDLIYRRIPVAGWLIDKVRARL
ncbi:MAG: nuclear transport factor 2 family protein [Verrucomicrobia bacterium]|nr:nuclear transport factor 2 family protein [Verrucomicrobiota bacterium]